MQPLQPFLGALPPVFAILFILAYGSGRVSERNAQRILARATKISSNDMPTVVYVISGALTVESFLVTMFAGFLSVSIVVAQGIAGAEMLLLVLIVIILVGTLISLRILFLYDYVQLATTFVENRHLKRIVGDKFTYSSCLRVTEIAINGAVALAILAAAVI